MAELPVASGREAVKAFGKIGYSVDRQRDSHIILRQAEPPHRRLTIPSTAQARVRLWNTFFRLAWIEAMKLKDSGPRGIDPSEERKMELSRQEQRKITRILDDYMRLWMAGEAQACADLYEESGDALAVDGTFLRGREEIKRCYDQVMSGKYTGLEVRSVQSLGIRPLGPGHALLDATWEVHAPSGEMSATTVIASFVVVRRDAEWKIGACRLMVPFRIVR